MALTAADVMGLLTPKPKRGRKRREPPVIDVTPVEVTHEVAQVVEGHESQVEEGAGVAAVADGSVRGRVDGRQLALPDHSPLGGSAAERFIACPGSRTLIAEIRQAGAEEDDPDYRQEGTRAHSLGERCLRSGEDPVLVALMEPIVTQETAVAVKLYVDYVRHQASLHGTAPEIEVRVHRPEIHELYFGQIDAWLDYRLSCEVVDYKNGVGVFVSPAENPQLMYYAGGKLGMAETADYPDSLPVKLTIAQPNAPGEPIRSWTTTAGYIRNWLRFVLVPAMRRTETDQTLDVGDHCRWCPAKLICPAAKGLVKTYGSLAPDMLKLLPHEELAKLYERIVPAKAVIKALEAEVMRRLHSGVAPEELRAKLVEGKANREWKADAPVEATLRDNAWQPLKLVSPAMAEGLGTKAARELVAEWAYKPPGKPVVAPIADGRATVAVQGLKETFAAYLETRNGE